MTTSERANPPIVSHDAWLAARLTHLEHEKELTKHHDRVTAERRRLPMVRVEKNYVFASPTGPCTLVDLFEDRLQLIMYHFMFAPEWDDGCPSCTGYVDALGDLSLLHARDTTFALVSRAPLVKLEAYKHRRGWSVPWYSAFGSAFPYDFHLSLDDAVAPIEYNYRTKADYERAGTPFSDDGPIERHGLSVFFRVDDAVFHTYSTYARGVEKLTDSYSLLDTTPYGRQEDWEDAPPGWPQRPTYG